MFEIQGPTLVVFEQHKFLFCAPLRTPKRIESFGRALPENGKVAPGGRG